MPWGFVNSMTASPLARLTKKKITYLAQIAESNVPWILLYLCKYVTYFSHIIIVSLLVSLSRVGFKVCESKIFSL